MSQEKNSGRSGGTSLDWLIGGVLSKVGDTFDRITGRNWNPSSNLATSKLQEKLKALLDSEVRDLGKEGKFVPHVFKLKIQWNKFSTDSDAELVKLEHELHAAAIDHINDRLYHTYAPISISVEKDYFVDGVQFIAGFGDFAESPDDEVAVHVTLASVPVEGARPKAVETVEEPPEERSPADRTITLSFDVGGKPQTRTAVFGDARRITIGRGSTNDIVIDDTSVSKSHAAIALTRSGEVVIADTGSTNGTFVGGRRMAYGKAVPIVNGTTIGIGEVRVAVGLGLTDEPAPTASGGEDDSALPSTSPSEVPDELPPTQASIDLEADGGRAGEDETDWEI